MDLVDPLAIALINNYQGGFPVVKNPYAVVASALKTDESELISLIKNLLDRGWLTRFGPLYDAKQLGGGLTLAALSVPQAQFAKVTTIVNAYAEVAHNYRREHRLNMWFVVAAETQQAVQDVIADIELNTGLKVFDCPKIREFYVGLKLHINDRGLVDTVPVDATWLHSNGANKATPPNEFERKIITATQAGLPLVPNPYEQISHLVDSYTETVMKSIEKLLNKGAMRRIGVVPNHYKLGLRGNGMTVWDVPDEKVIETGARIGGMAFVSHCYQRPRHLPDWPYNLFAMIHGSNKEQVMKKLVLMEEELLPAEFNHDVLFSSEILKKSGLRLTA